MYKAIELSSELATQLQYKKFSPRSMQSLRFRQQNVAFISIRIQQTLKILKFKNDVAFRLQRVNSRKLVTFGCSLVSAMAEVTTAVEV